jgi:hypothetical protein
MPCMPGTPRAPSYRTCTLWTGGPVAILPTAPPVAHAGRGLGPRARLGNHKRASGGRHAHLRVGAPPLRSRPRAAPAWMTLESASSNQPPPSKTPSPCPALPIARRPVHEFNRAPTSPDRQPRRPPPLATGVPAPPATPLPNRAPNSNPSRP